MTDQGSQESVRGYALGWAGAGVLLVGVLLRAVVGFEVFPLWDFDPFLQRLESTGLGPTGILVLDGVTLVGASLCLLAGARAGRGVHPISMLLLLSGAAGVVIHGVSDLGDLLLGTSWCAALSAGLGVWALGALPRVRSIVAGVALGFVCLLVVKGAIQVYIDHPATVAQYEQTRETFLASRGWEPDSASAQAYERRLYQAEASGWFGLSNVYSTFAAAGFASCVLLGWIGWRTGASRAACVWVFVAAGSGAAALWLSGSKGGVGAALLGIAIGVGSLVGFRRRVLCVAAIVVPLFAVTVRGLLGERIGELSLLFRWFYMQGSVRIWGSEPALGVGPTGFKEAYTLRKPGLSPEEVMSPHSVLFDWTACLGVFGLAWCATLVLWSVPRRGDVVRGVQFKSWPWRWVLGIAMVIPSIAVFWSSVIEAALTTPEAALGKLLGLGLWGGSAWAIATVLLDPRVMGRAWMVFLVAGGVVIAHIQIEMSAVLATSAPLCGVLIGCGIQPRGHRQGRVHLWLACGPAVIAVVVFGLGFGAVLRWESSLREAARYAWASQEQLADQIALRVAAAEALGNALNARPMHAGTRIAYSRVYGDLALGAGARGDEEGFLRWSEAAMRPLYSDVELGTQILSWRGVLGLGLSTYAVDDELKTTWILNALHDAEEAAELAPGATVFAVRAMDLHAQLGHFEAAAAWAHEALERNERLRLDPVRRMSSEDVERALALVEAARDQQP